MPDTKIPKTFLATSATSHVCRTCGVDKPLKSFPTITGKPDERGTECRKCRDSRVETAHAEGKPVREAKPKEEKAAERVAAYNAKREAAKAAKEAKKAADKPQDEVAAKRAAKESTPEESVECGTCHRSFSPKGFTTHRQRTGHGA